MMEPIERYNEHLALSQQETKSACRRLIKLKEEGHPISNSTAYFESVADKSKYSCHVPKVLVTVEWNGDVRVCSTISEDVRPDLDLDDLGNLRENRFSEIFGSSQYQEYINAAEECWKCDLSYPREIFHSYSLDRRSMRNFMTSIMG